MIKISWYIGTIILINPNIKLRVIFIFMLRIDSFNSGN